MTRRERTLAVVLGLTLLVGLLDARHLRRADQPSGLAAAVTVRPFDGRATIGLVQVELRLRGTPNATFTGEARATGGWRVAAPATVGPGHALLLLHEVTCPTAPFPVVRLRTVDGRLLRLAVDDHPVDLCNPVTGAAALQVGGTSLLQDPPRLTVDVLDVSTEPVTVEAVRFPGFAFDGELPLTVPGRDRGGAVLLGSHNHARLRFAIRVTGCTTAQAALRAAVASARLEELPFEAAGGGSTFTVPGLESYLETLWRRTCVR